MNINIKATNIELTDAIREYVEKKVESVSKFLNNSNVQVQVEVAKTTNHHKNGEVFKAEIDIRADGKKFFTVSEGEDLYATIDEARESMMRELTHNKDRERTLYKRGAASVKKMLKGISKRNPFTSK
ncbi:MAG: putative sigma-54 modulation protein [Patescibacteria group bacterium]|jgi:putative sigma-54 modulation protein|nr:putative sigma-54 modulation protein [Patescibacteria group bacterium]